MVTIKRGNQTSFATTKIRENSVMYTFTVGSIKKTKCWINGVRTNLEFPTPELFQQRAYSISLKGWVSLNEDIDEICLSWLGIRIASAQLFSRVDLQQNYPENKNTAGFELHAVPIVFGREEPLQIVLTTKGGRSSPLFEIYLCFDDNRVQTEPSDSKTPTFALIVGAGRSGTTLLAQLLLRSSAVVGYDEYPYEAHLASRLFMKWFLELQPAHYLSKGNSESTDQGLSAIRSILLNCAGDRQRLDAMTALTERQRRRTCDHIRELYQMISPQKAASVIVEKSDADNDLSFWLMREMFPTFRPIFLIRDPRDVILSRRSFNEKRGDYRFHEANILQIPEQVQWLASALRRLAWYYDHFGDAKLLVKYEDLVRNSPEVMRQIFAYLEIDHSPQEIAKFLHENPAQDKHVTSSSPEASIGRWKNELSESQKETVNWILEPFIRRFGY
jgi:hypothetical protein